MGPEVSALTMIRLKATRRFHISNRLALVSALTLALTLYSGTNEPMHSEFQSAASVNTDVTVAEAIAGPDEQHKRFSISRLLFGHG